MDEEENKIDFFSPEITLAFICAFIGDVTFFFILTHYFCGAIAIGCFWHKTKGWAAKTILIIAFILPLPLLTAGIWAAILLSNKIIAFLVQQAAIQGIAAVTAGAGEALEGVALAEEGVEALEAVEALETAGEAGEVALEAEEAATEAAEAGETAQEQPESEESEKDKTSKRIKDKIKDRLQQQGSDEEEEENEEESKEDAADERYKEIVTPEIERNPIDVAMEKELGEEPIMIQASRPAPAKTKEKSPKEKLDDRAKRRQQKSQNTQQIDNSSI